MESQEPIPNREENASRLEVVAQLRAELIGILENVETVWHTPSPHPQAARLFAEQLKADARVGDFRVVASHQESLHSHDAISVLVEGETFAATSLEPHLFNSLIHRG